MRYRDYIKSPAWQRRRQTKLESVGRKCEWCSDRKRLAVHHLNYKRLGRELSSDLLVLCNGCHWVADEMRKNPDSDLLARFKENPPKSTVEAAMGSPKQRSLKTFMARKRYKGA